MSRLYVIESTPSSTGMKADHRVPVRAGDIEGFARILQALVQNKVSGAGSPLAVGTASFEDQARGATKFDRTVAADLLEHRGSSVVIAGDHLPPAVHALAHAMNQALGNVGQTVFYTEPVDAYPVNQYESLYTLVQDIRAGEVDLLLILGGNPVYDAPPSF